MVPRAWELIGNPGLARDPVFGLFFRLCVFFATLDAFAIAHLLSLASTWAPAIVAAFCLGGLLVVATAGSLVFGILVIALAPIAAVPAMLIPPPYVYLYGVAFAWAWFGVSLGQVLQRRARWRTVLHLYGVGPALAILTAFALLAAGLEHWIVEPLGSGTPWAVGVLLASVVVPAVVFQVLNRWRGYALPVKCWGLCFFAKTAAGLPALAWNALIRGWYALTGRRMLVIPGSLVRHAATDRLRGEMERRLCVRVLEPEHERLPERGCVFLFTLVGVAKGKLGECILVLPHTREPFLSIVALGDRALVDRIERYFQGPGAVFLFQGYTRRSHRLEHEVHIVHREIRQTARADALAPLEQRLVAVEAAARALPAREQDLLGAKAAFVREEMRRREFWLAHLPAYVLYRDVQESFASRIRVVSEGREPDPEAVARFQAIQDRHDAFVPSASGDVEAQIVALFRGIGDVPPLDYIVLEAGGRDPRLGNVAYGCEDDPPAPLPA